MRSLAPRRRDPSHAYTAGRVQTGGTTRFWTIMSSDATMVIESQVDQILVGNVTKDGQGIFCGEGASAVRSFFVASKDVSGGHASLNPNEVRVIPGLCPWQKRHAFLVLTVACMAM